MNIEKRLINFINSKIANYIFTRYTRFVKMIHEFVNYIDNFENPELKTIIFSKDGLPIKTNENTYQSSVQDILNLTQNLDEKFMSNKFLNFYYDNYCKDIVNNKTYKLDEVIKKQMLRMGKLWYNNKGKVFSLTLATKYLNKYFIGKNNEELTSQELNYFISEDEKYWFSIDNNPYMSPYSYLVEGEFPIEYISELLDIANPVGFYPVFKYLIKMEELLILNSNPVNLTDEGISLDISYAFGNFENEQFKLITQNVEDLTISGIKTFIDVDEQFNIYPKLLCYNNDNLNKYNFKYDGGETYGFNIRFDGKGKGIYEDITIKIYKNDVLQETYETDTVSYYNDFYSN